MDRVCIVMVALWLAVTGLAAGDDVVLYTNADLERFGQPSPAPEPAAPPDAGEQWSFVRGFIEGEYRRIDAERQHELDWAALRVQEATTSFDEGRYYGGYSLGYGYYGQGGRRKGNKHLRQGSGVRYGNLGFPTVRERYFTRPTPIHARPRVGATPRYRTGSDARGGGRNRGGGGKRR